MIKNYTVSEVNRFVKQIFSYEQIFYNISVIGEVSNLKYHAMGNVFFTLKDENSAIKCVMFKMYAENASFFLKDGMFVSVRGDLNVYEKNGTYQIYVTVIEQQGEGLIRKKVDFLREKLLKEGLFDVDKKISLIKFPKVVGVITAINGAALQDVIKILSKRLPILRLKVFSCLVQGEGAVKSILKALNKAACDEEVENLIICRGGGSSEDLNPFDDEDVCRMVSQINKPTISAIGHETDYCLLDLVADFRASTPSVAAQVVCVDCGELIDKINENQRLIKIYFKNFIDSEMLKLKNLKNRLILKSPENVLKELRFKFDNFTRKLIYLISKIFLIFANKVESYSVLLKVLSPIKVLDKGYCLMFKNSVLIKSISEVEDGSILNLILKDGGLKVKVIEKSISRKVK